LKKHVPALDGLRGIAILLVLAHGFDVIQTGEGLGRRVELALDLGWIGVQLFFVLSGFLITGILLDAREGNEPHYFRTFFLRRTFRIFPLYYAVLLVAAIAGVLGANQIFLWTYTANFAAPLGYGEPAFPHFWSLCVEEQFYLVWPLVVYLVRRRGLLPVGVLVTIIAIVARVLVREHVNPDAAYQFSFCRMDALAIGAMTASYVRGSRKLEPPAIVLAALGSFIVLGGAVLGHLLRTGPVMQTGGYTIMAIGFALIVVATLDETALPAKLLGLALLRRIGKYSYGMYVFYAPLHVYLGLPLLGGIAMTAERGVFYMITASLATFAFAAASYHVFEEPFLKLKDKLAPR